MKPIVAPGSRRRTEVPLYSGIRVLDNERT